MGLLTVLESWGVSNADLKSFREIFGNTPSRREVGMIRMHGGPWRKALMMLLPSAGCSEVRRALWAGKEGLVATNSQVGFADICSQAQERSPLKCL
jgi:hypothetical protein